MPRVSLPPVELTRENITGFFSFYYQRAGWIWDTSAFPSCISKTPFGKTVQLDSQTWWPRPDRKTLCHSLSPCKQQTFPPLLQEIPTAWALGCKTKINFAYFDLRFSYNQQGTCLFSSNWADAHTAPPPTSPSHALGQCRGMFWASSLHGNILCFSVMSVLLAVSLTRSSHPSKPVL